MENPENFCRMESPVRHLTYHICPFLSASEAWKWNLVQLSARWGLFNGQKILGINFDSLTASPQEIIDFCSSIGMIWDVVIIRQNNRYIGEVMTWVPSLCELPFDSCSQNDIVFSAHAKGVKYGGSSPPVIRLWTDVMYQANLDYIGKIQNSLEWFSSVGCFRARSPRNEQCRNGWHYSGAFWWWRLLDLAKKDWKDVGNTYVGREFWIGHHILQSESDCLFMDRSKSPYQMDYWRDVVLPKWIQFKRKQNE